MKRLMFYASFIACGAMISAQDVSVFELVPNETATAIVAYAKYLKAKEAWVGAASKIAEAHGVTCPAFSKGFAYVIQDPQCDEQDGPSVDTRTTLKAMLVKYNGKTQRSQTKRATRQ